MRWTNHQQLRMLEMTAAGHTTREISAAIGHSMQAIYRRRRDLGVAGPMGRPRLDGGYPTLRWLTDRLLQRLEQRTRAAEPNT